MTRWETIIRLTFMALSTIVIGVSFIQGWQIALFLWTLSFGYLGGRLAQAHLFGEANRGRHR